VTIKRERGSGTVYGYRDGYRGERRKRGFAPISVDGRTELEAHRLLDHAIERQEEQQSHAVDPTLGEWIERWLANVGAAKSPRTAAVDRWALDQLGRSICERRLRALSVAGVEEELARLRDRPKRPRRSNPSTQRPSRGRGSGPLGHSSLIKVKRSLAEVLTEAERHEIIVRNVAKLARIPVGATPKGERRSLTPAEARSLIEAAEGEGLEALIVTALYTGLRPGELLGLPWTAVDLDAGTLVVRQALHRQDGGGVAIAAPKAKSDRVLALPDNVVEALRAHQRRQKAERLAAPVWEDHGLVFPNVIGRPVDHANLRREVRRLCAVAGIDPPITSHELRHSAASLLVAAGMPLEEVADLLGHADVTMLAEVYRHRTKRVVDLREGQARMLEG
jgi:integrase